jgi:hypothetical protein
MRNELKESLFFQPRPDSGQAETDQAPKAKSQGSSRSRQRSTSQPRAAGGTGSKGSGVTVSRHHATTAEAIGADQIERIRQSVRQIGKEAATHRFTLEEKRALKEIEYAYGSRGVRTSENEITRIAVNHLVQDYRENGEDSILAQVIERLNR